MEEETHKTSGAWFTTLWVFGGMEGYPIKDPRMVTNDTGHTEAGRNVSIGDVDGMGKMVDKEAENTK